MANRENIDPRHLIKRGINIIRFSYRYRYLIPIILGRISSRLIDKAGGYPNIDAPDQKKLIHDINWDILIVLDACRYDAYKSSRASKLPGNIEYAWSPASITPHWIMRTWLDNKWNDIIYISANIFVNKSLGVRKHLHRLFLYDLRDKFMDIIEVWRRGMDRKLYTVTPWTVYRSYKMAKLRMELKGMRLGRDYRMVIHFMQPHTPYINHWKINRLIYSLDKEIMKSGTRLGFEYLYIPYLRRHLSKRDVDNLIWNGYMDNLNIALSYVEKIIGENKGKTIIITSDHGEMMGEYNLYFHFDIETIQLRLVPFHIIS
ncbi:MAG TPA: hypothetical protein EYH44_04535 [Thermoprotei archaeon]|nr:hypothetical protein [Thermoprotei archaeon]